MEINTKDCPGPHDGMLKARDGEPVFTLLGRDVLAPRLVRKWASLRRSNIIGREHKLSDEQRRAELLQCTEAEELSYRMDEYRRGTPQEEDDAPVAPSTVAPSATEASYTGFVPSEDMIAATERNRFMILAAERIDNAVAEIAERIEPLRGYGMADVANVLERATEDLRIASEAVRPKRSATGLSVARGPVRPVIDA